MCVHKSTDGQCKFLNVWMVIVLFLKKWQLALLFPWILLSDEHLNNLVSWNVKIQNSRGKINPYVLKLDLFEFFRHKNCSFKDWVETAHLLLSSTAPYALITKLNYPFHFIGCFDCHLKEALLRDVTKQNKQQIPSYITAWFLACRLVFGIGESCLLLLFFFVFSWIPPLVLFAEEDWARVEETILRLSTLIMVVTWTEPLTHAIKMSEIQASQSYKKSKAPPKVCD